MPWNEPGSGNKDPWGNGNRNRGNQGPDIEQVIENVRKRFGGGGRGSGGRGGLFSPFVIFIVFAVIYWASQSIYQVEEGSESYELRFGKYKQTVGAGLRFIAWPIEEKIVINTQEVRTVEVGYRGNTPEIKEALMLTRDENIVDVTMAVQYTIKEVKDLVENVGDLRYRDGLERVVRSATESALREVVGSTKMDDLLTTDRPVVDAKTETLLQQVLDRYQAGIQIESIEIQDAKPPSQVSDAFADVVKANQDKETLVNQAQAYSKSLIPNARGQAERVIQEAEGYKARVVAEATGEAERFNKIVTEYTKAPQITKKRLYIEAMEGVLSQSSKVLIDQNGGNGNSLMYLPIDKIIENNAANNRAANAGAAKSARSSKSNAGSNSQRTRNTQTRIRESR